MRACLTMVGTLFGQSHSHNLAFLACCAEVSAIRTWSGPRWWRQSGQRGSRLLARRCNRAGCSPALGRCSGRLRWRQGQERSSWRRGSACAARSALSARRSASAASSITSILRGRVVLGGARLASPPQEHCREGVNTLREPEG